MTLRLILMRHAKSSWKSDAPDDHARPLNKRGRRDAPRIAEALYDQDWWPQLVLSSDALRTLQTWSLMAPERPEAPLHTHHSLYHGGIHEICGVIEPLASVQTILVLGHNPGWQDALTWLSGDDAVLTTANAALLTTQAPSWAQAFAGPQRFETVRILRPKSLPAS